MVIRRRRARDGAGELTVVVGSIFPPHQVPLRISTHFVHSVPEICEEIANEALFVLLGNRVLRISGEDTVLVDPIEQRGTA